MNEKIEHVQKLIFKAESDLRAARALIECEQPPTDAICFHCQQAVEKTLKAWLHWHEIRSPRTHNLAEILEICKLTDSSFTRLGEIETLTPYAVELRYADDFYFPPVEEARGALHLAEETADFVRTALANLGVNLSKNFEPGG